MDARRRWGVGGGVIAGGGVKGSRRGCEERESGGGLMSGPRAQVTQR